MAVSKFAAVGLLAVLPLLPLQPVPEATTHSSVTVAVVGDIACDPDSSSYRTCHHDETAALISRVGVDAVLALGDLQYETGSASDWPKAYEPTYGAFKAITYPIPGNHEYGTAGARPYFDYFGPRAGDPTKGYYAFWLNRWRVYALNMECAYVDCTSERAWMVADAKSKPATCQLLYGHRPRYSSGEHGSSLGPRQFWAVGYNNRFDVALAGHDHDYERFAKMDHEGNVVSNGIRSFVSGAGGKSLYPIGTAVTGSRVRYDDNYGVLFLTLASGSYSWKFRSIAGDLVDSGSQSCQ